MYTIWTQKAADVATAHVAVGALSFMWGVLMYAALRRWGQPVRIAHPLSISRRPGSRWRRSAHEDRRFAREARPGAVDAARADGGLCRRHARRRATVRRTARRGRTGRPRGRGGLLRTGQVAAHGAGARHDAGGLLPRLERADALCADAQRALRHGAGGCRRGGAQRTDRTRRRRRHAPHAGPAPARRAHGAEHRAAHRFRPRRGRDGVAARARQRAQQRRWRR